MNNIISNHRNFVINQIQKSFDSNELEKAWKIGDTKQYQGKTYFVGGFNAKGQPLWRLKKDTNSGNTDSNKTEDKGDFINKFKNADESILKRIISGDIKATDSNRKDAQRILDERKKKVVKDEAAKRIIDTIKISSSKFTDINKVVVFKTLKGNWAVDYDGSNTGLILSKNKFSKKDFETAGVKIEG